MEGGHIRAEFPIRWNREFWQGEQGKRLFGNAVAVLENFVAPAKPTGPTAGRPEDRLRASRGPWCRFPTMDSGSALCSARNDGVNKGVPENSQTDSKSRQLQAICPGTGMINVVQPHSRRVQCRLDRRRVVGDDQ